MMTEKNVRVTLDEYKDEGGFDYKGKSYFYSCCMAPEGKILIDGPDNHEQLVDTVDEVLDKLLVDGKPLREMLKYID